MKLSQFPPKVRYTLTEAHLFATLPKNGRKMTSADIVKAREAHGEWNVKFPLKNVTVQMNRLIDKVDANKEPFRIHKDGKYPGHEMVEYWLQEREPAPAKRSAASVAKKNGKAKR